MFYFLCANVDTFMPKDEDFYQFQYVRGDEAAEHGYTILGASIPFQLKSPSNDELCTVEDEQEFMVVQTSTALATGQMSDKLGSLSDDNSRLKVRHFQSCAMCMMTFHNALFLTGTSQAV